MTVTILTGGSDVTDGQGVLALVTSEIDDDVVLAMFSADFDHEHEDPPFSVVVSVDELLRIGQLITTHAQEHITRQTLDSLEAENRSLG